MIERRDTRMAEQGSLEPEAARTRDVVRDATFARFVADEGVIFEMGRDLEVAFLQYGALLTAQTDLGSSERTDVKNVVTEVARMRIGQNEFLTIVMNFIRLGILEGRMNGERIQSSIVEWTSAAAERSGVAEGEES